MTKKRFKKIVWEYYRVHGRHKLLWRTPAHIRHPYRVLVSEVMLQQTQVSRVIVKYPEFIKRFPNFQSLAKAPAREVLRVWQGMGYNRRALFLKKLAEIVVGKYRGVLPSDFGKLSGLPGIGKATAGSLMAFVFNKPAVFIETNIRRAYIHSFFPDKEGVSDVEIAELVGATMDKTRPREWYYALMDHGAMLGAPERANPNRKSAGYRAQPKFAGSRRALRGKVLKFLLGCGKSTEQTLVHELHESEERIREVLEALGREKFVVKRNGVVKLL